MSTATPRQHPLLLACRCRVSRPCMTCMRWLRHHNTVTQRRQAWKVRP